MEKVKIENIDNLEHVEKKIEKKLEKIKKKKIEARKNEETTEEKKIESNEEKKGNSEEYPEFEIGFDPFQDQTNKQ